MNAFTCALIGLMDAERREDDLMRHKIHEGTKAVDRFTRKSRHLLI